VVLPVQRQSGTTHTCRTLKVDGETRPCGRAPLRRPWSTTQLGLLRRRPLRRRPLGRRPRRSTAPIGSPRARTANDRGGARGRLSFSGCRKGRGPAVCRKGRGQRTCRGRLEALEADLSRLGPVALGARGRRASSAGVPGTSGAERRAQARRTRPARAATPPTGTGPVGFEEAESEDPLAGPRGPAESEDSSEDPSVGPEDPVGPGGAERRRGDREGFPARQRIGELLDLASAIKSRFGRDSRLESGYPNGPSTSNRRPSPGLGRAVVRGAPQRAGARRSGARKARPGATDPQTVGGRTGTLEARTRRV